MNGDFMRDKKDFFKKEKEITGMAFKVAKVVMTKFIKDFPNVLDRFLSLSSKTLSNTKRSEKNQKMK